MTPIKQVKTILSDKTYTPKNKENALLELDCSLYTNLGLDSTKKEKDRAHGISRRIYTEIQQLGNEASFLLGSFLLKTMDL